MSHTEGKLTAWDRGIGFEIYGQHGSPINDEFRGTFTEADARRLVACWNLCQGKDTHELEQMIELGDGLLGLMEFAGTRERERDEALDVLREIRKEVVENGVPTVCEETVYERCEAILAKHQKVTG